MHFLFTIKHSAKAETEKNIKNNMDWGGPYFFLDLFLSWALADYSMANIKKQPILLAEHKHIFLTDIWLVFWTKIWEIQDVCFSPATAAAKAAASPSLSGHQQIGFAQKSFWLLFPAGISLKPFWTGYFNMIPACGPQTRYLSTLDGQAQLVSAICWAFLG